MVVERAAAERRAINAISGRFSVVDVLVVAGIASSNAISNKRFNNYYKIY